MASRPDLRRALLGTALGLALCASAAPARAADDGYQNVFQSVLGAVGLMPEDKSPSIEYRERAPLVLPPTGRQLAAPAASASRGANWPQDPDVLARQQAREEANAPMLSLFDKRVDRPDSKAEMMKHRAAQTDDATPGYCGNSSHGDAACRLTAGDMQRQDAKFRADNPDADKAKNVITAGVESDRQYLTQPPKGYLKATKTVKATAEAPDVHRDTSSPLSTLINHVKPDDE